MRGAWIEINDSGNADYTSVVAPHAGAWIEILRKVKRKRRCEVAPHAGSAD